MNIRQFFTLEQVAEMFEVHERTVMRWLEKKELTGFKVGGAWRFEQSDIDRYVERQRKIAEEDVEITPAVAKEVDLGKQPDGCEPITKEIPFIGMSTLVVFADGRTPLRGTIVRKEPRWGLSVKAEDGIEYRTTYEGYGGRGKWRAWKIK